MNIDSVNEQYYMGQVVKAFPSNFGGQPQCKGAAVKLDHLTGNKYVVTLSRPDRKCNGVGEWEIFDQKLKGTFKFITGKPRQASFSLSNKEI